MKSDQSPSDRKPFMTLAGAGFGVADAKPYLNVPNSSVAHQLLGESVFVGSMVANQRVLRQKKAESAAV